MRKCFKCKMYRISHPTHRYCDICHEWYQHKLYTQGALDNGEPQEEDNRDEYEDYKELDFND